ncbi:MAG: hypothetical protein ACLQB1_07050 [Streptosporangiaceae bacterium]
MELLTSGVLAPLHGFMNAAAVAAVTERGMLADGTPWSVPVTLDVPADAVPADADSLVLQDQEGSPLAVLSITERLGAPGAADDCFLVVVDGNVGQQIAAIIRFVRRPLRIQLGEKIVLAMVDGAIQIDGIDHQESGRMQGRDRGLLPDLLIGLGGGVVTQVTGTRGGEFHGAMRS